MYLFIFESRHMSFELFIFPFFWGGGLVVGEIKIHQNIEIFATFSTGDFNYYRGHVNTGCKNLYFINPNACYDIRGTILLLI